jgi:hypothetical protein
MAKIKKSFKALNIQERTIKYQAHIEQEKALKKQQRIIPSLFP